MVIYAFALPCSSKPEIYSLKSASFCSSVKSPVLSLKGRPVKISVDGLLSCAVTAAEFLDCSIIYSVNSLVYPIEPVSMDETASSLGRMIPETFKDKPLS